MLTIRNLSVRIEDTLILSEINLNLEPGHIYAMMGPNGSGKSTFAFALMGAPSLTVSGDVHYQGHNILSLATEDRAKLGFFLCFQNPVALPGVSIASFIQATLNYCRQAGTPAMDRADFLAYIKPKLEQLSLEESFLNRNVNEDLSGGEKKRLELLQMLCLDPAICILDEPDSGLDVDGIRLMEAALLDRRKNNKITLIISHYGHLLNNLNPEVVHLLIDGHLKMSGDCSLAQKIEKEGYQWIR